MSRTSIFIARKTPTGVPHEVRKAYSAYKGDDIRASSQTIIMTLHATLARTYLLESEEQMYDDKATQFNTKRILLRVWHQTPHGKDQCLGPNYNNFTRFPKWFLETIG